MRLLKVIVVIFIVYFVRRFIQMYRAMQKLQEEARVKQPEKSSSVKSDVVEADYRVMD